MNDERLKLSAHIGSNIKRLRKKKGLNQSNLAIASGISRQQLERIENAKVSANVYSLHSISKALKVKLPNLLK